VHELVQRVLRHIRREGLIHPGQRVAVAVSGGADSVSLLRLLSELNGELGIVLFAAHFNHRLRGQESDSDQQFVEDLCLKLKIALLADSGHVRSLAARDRLSLETAARNLRYEFFRRLLTANRLDRIATAHTLDDQAETVLMKFTRGAGTRGLAGIYPQLRVDNGLIIRPLLPFKRIELESYLNWLDQDWRADSSNRDLHHSRNRVRHCILPMIESELNPSVRETLAGSAEIARAEEQFWEAETAKLLPKVAPGEAIMVPEFRLLPSALQRRMLLVIADSLGLQLTFRHVAEICEIATQETAATECSLPGGWSANRKGNTIEFTRPAVRPEPQDYEYPLNTGGKTTINEAGSTFGLKLASFSPEYNPRDCLPAHLSQKGLRVRNWRAGDRFQPAHSKSPKKIKELLQAMHINGAARKLWPVILAEDTIVWMRGIGSFFSPKSGDEVIVVHEIRSSGTMEL
jgi:tRNA(Ile)-lysidine synthase